MGARDLDITVSSVKCKVCITSASRHLHQLYTGLALLDRAGAIDLEISVAARCDAESRCTMLVNGATLVFDMNDADGVQRKFLADCDFYFKRSYSHSVVQRTAFPHKVFPYGLNYQVLPDFFSPLFFRLSQATGGLKGAFKYLAKQLDRYSLAHFDPTVSTMQAPPVRPRQFSLLFMARAWDHEYDRDFEMTGKVSEDRLRINQVRGNCIRALRKEFGHAFTGGLAHSDYARRHFPDCLAPSAGMTSKRSYIELVKRHAVCVATAGLHQSIGGKFGEYVALSRAILSEKLAFEVPGELSAGRHYLEFQTVDECLEQACRLADDTDRLYEIMRHNHDYYERSLRPDALLWNCFSQAL